jgi:glycosyltransferase involved in cell wall biosynthesis
MLLPKSIPCSVLILTRNSAGTLERCLRNLAPFEEILVHDANSEDNSAEIARRFGARVLPQEKTTERSTRVKDFTAMRLKQRAAAQYDWVFYLDSDEYLSDGLVEEIGLILKTAVPKTIVKVRRVWVINDVPRTRGYLSPDIMPRLHHRGSGATLRAGKTVHEKYEYDGTFKEVIAKYPLYVPMDSVTSLRAKDDRYILLEIERTRQRGYTWGLYFRWFFFREPLIMLGLLWRILWKLPGMYGKDAVPPAYHFRYVRYHWRLLRAMTGWMLERKL